MTLVERSSYGSALHSYVHFCSIGPEILPLQLLVQCTPFIYLCSFYEIFITIFVSRPDECVLISTVQTRVIVSYFVAYSVCCLDSLIIF